MKVIVALVIASLVCSGRLVTSVSTEKTTLIAKAAPPDPGGFDYFLFSAFWPPSLIAPAAHGRARWLIKSGYASPGFWSHGLWPSRVTGAPPELCSKEAFDPTTLGPFVNTLAYFLRSPTTTVLPDKLTSFWSHEWSRHGTCSGKDQLTYFTDIYATSLHIDVHAVLVAAGIKPSITAKYTLGQMNTALKAAYGPAYDPSIGMACAPPAVGSGPPVLREVRICLSRATLQPVDCNAPSANPYNAARTDARNADDASGTADVRMATPARADAAAASAPAAGGAGDREAVPWPPEAWGPGAELREGWARVALQQREGAGQAADKAAPDTGYRLGAGACGSAPTDPLQFPDYEDSDGVALLPWSIILRVLVGALLVGAALAGGYHLLQHWRLIPALFTPRPVVEVHYDLVQQPVSVCVEPLHMEQLWDSLPHIAAFVEDLPVGMGIKGGIARKLLKERVGVPEPPGSFDVDVLLFVHEYTPEARHAARETVTGCHLGGLVLEPQDCEVLTKEWLAEYFISRDVTQNEVLILKTAPGQAQLYFTEQARDDCAANLIRPCVHALKTEFHLVWEVEKDGVPYTAGQQVCRSLVRYLKGHGSDYAFDRATWEHYRRVGLSKTELFKVLRPFHDDDRKMQTAVDHLVDIGFLPRHELRKAGGVNMLWGLLLQEVNATVSRHGGRFVLNSLDADAVERWVESKKASTASRLIAEEMRSARTGYVQADESVLDLGLLTFPPQLVDFIADGPVFDSEAFLRSAAAAAASALAGGAHAGHAAKGGGAPAAAEAAHAPAAGEAEREAALVPAGKVRWAAVQSAAAAGGGLVYQVMRGAGAAGGRGGGVAPGGPQHAAAGAASGPGAEPAAPGAAARPPGAAARMEDELQREVDKLREALLQPAGKGDAGTGPVASLGSMSRAGMHTAGSPGFLANLPVAGSGAAERDGGSGRAGGLRRGQGEAAGGADAAAGGGLSAPQRQLREMASAAQEGRRRQNTALKELIGASLTARAGSGQLPPAEAEPGSPAAPAGSGAPPAAAAAAAPGEVSSAAAAGAAGGSAAEAAADWTRYSALGEQLGKADQRSADTLGSFYEQGAASSGLMGMLGWGDGGAGAAGEDGYIPLVGDDEGPKRRRPTLGKLFAFLVGVMAIDKPSLLAAYGLMLCGLVARLCVPRVEAALLDAFNELEVDLFWANLILALGLVLADALLTLCGQLAMEVFTRNSMRVLFRRFFEHVVFQDLPFFARLSPGELMARTSGDSLTLRGIVSSTIYKFVEGAVLFLGATAFLLFSANHLLVGRPQLVLVFIAVAAVDVAEAGLLGVWLRRVNLAVRQSLGRMFGFTLSIFAHIPLVSSLGLELRCVSDYRRFASDYFANTLLLNCLLHAHNALTGLLAAVLRFSLLALGGAALFDGVTTVGSLIALLSYCSWLQRGLKQASDSWARLMAGLGSVERLVELHDRGTFGAVVPVDVGSAGADGEGPAGSARLFREVPGTSGHDHAGDAEHGSAAAGTASHKTPRRRSGREGAEAEPLMGWGSEGGAGGDVEEGEVLTTGDAVHRRAFWTPGRPDRPDFGRMLGGVKLVGVQLTTRGRAENLLLRDVTMTVEAGQVAVLTGADPEGLHGLLSLLMLRYPPYKGSLAFQLPRGALPSAAALLGPDPLDRLLRRGGRQQAQQGAEGGSGAEWEWSTFSFRHDDLRPPRSRVALISRSMTGLFRTSVEDNVAVAAPDRQVTSAEVRRVCAAAGLHEEVNALPDGYFTLLGEGTGNSLSTHGLLRLAVARALLRRPALVLVEDVDAFAEALGEGALRGLLQQLRSEGAAVVVACGPAAGARWGWADVRLHLHAGALHAEGEAQ